MSEVDSNKIDSPTIATAGLSAVAVALVQLGFPNDADAAIRGILSTGVPLCVGAIVYMAQWVFVRWGFKPIKVMEAEKNLISSISFLEEQIANAKKAKRDSTTLESKLTNTILARANLYENGIGKK